MNIAFKRIRVKSYLGLAFSISRHSDVIPQVLQQDTYLITLPKDSFGDTGLFNPLLSFN